ncbi:hypothetical protein C8F01DRAFT_1228212 [Mycena amicta]|nr:hypothetical protein C8F01DRAFT_1228212 [Mycena amicta]
MSTTASSSPSTSGSSQCITFQCGSSSFSTIYQVGGSAAVVLLLLVGCVIGARLLYLRRQRARAGTVIRVGVRGTFSAIQVETTPPKMYDVYVDEKAEMLRRDELVSTWECMLPLSAYQPRPYPDNPILDYKPYLPRSRPPTHAPVLIPGAGASTGLAMAIFSRNQGPPRIQTSPPPPSEPVNFDAQHVPMTLTTPKTTDTNPSDADPNLPLTVICVICMPSHHPHPPEHALVPSSPSELEHSAAGCPPHVDLGVAALETRSTDDPARVSKALDPVVHA